MSTTVQLLCHVIYDYGLPLGDLQWSFELPMGARPRNQQRRVYVLATVLGSCKQARGPGDISHLFRSQLIPFRQVNA